jgi:hypothetical protein
MASKTSIIYTARDQQIHQLLAITPLDTKQLLKASVTFEQPFTTDRKLRERMQEHETAGWIYRFSYPTTTTGTANYYRLSAIGYRMLNGPDASLPKQSAFREVSPALQRHTRDLADVVVHTNVHARQLGIEILEQVGENRLTLVLGDREQKPDYSFRLATPQGVYTYYDELDESTEPISSTKQRESLESKIRFHEDYQNATGERYRVRMIFAKATTRINQFIELARKYGTQQRCIFYAALLENYLKHGSPLTTPIFLDHFGRLQPLVPTPQSRYQGRLPTLAELLAKPAAVS